MTILIILGFIFVFAVLVIIANLVELFGEHEDELEFFPIEEDGRV